MAPEGPWRGSGAAVGPLLEPARPFPLRPERLCRATFASSTRSRRQTDRAKMFRAGSMHPAGSALSFTLRASTSSTDGRLAILREDCSGRPSRVQREKTRAKRPAKRLQPGEVAHGPERGCPHPQHARTTHGGCAFHRLSPFRRAAGEDTRAPGRRERPSPGLVNPPSDRNSGGLKGLGRPSAKSQAAADGRRSKRRGRQPGPTGRRCLAGGTGRVTARSAPCRISATGRSSPDSQPRGAAQRPCPASAKGAPAGRRRG